MPIIRYPCKHCGKPYPASGIAKITDTGFVCQSCNRTNRRTKVSVSKSKPGRVNPRSGSTYKQITATKVHSGDIVRDIRTKAYGYVQRVHENNLWVRWDDGEYSVTTRRNVIKVMGKGPGASRLPNPDNGKRVLVYGQVLRIEAKKTQPHRCDAACKRSDHRYFHDFKASSKAQIIGMPAGTDSKDRSLRIVSKERD